MPVTHTPFEVIIRKYRALEKGEDVLALTNITERCLRVNPADRATALELLEDPWWEGAA